MTFFSLSTSDEDILPLSMAAVGQKVHLQHVAGGKRLTRRLVKMGLTPGVELTVIQKSGPLLLAVRDSRVAIGRGMAHKIQVSK